MGTLFKRTDRGGKSGKWYAEYTDASGERVKKSTGTRDKRTAEQILAAWETEAVKMRAGLVDPNAERMREQQLREVAHHVDEYLASLKSAGKSEKHRDRTKQQIDDILTFTGWNALREFSPEKLEKFLVHLREQKLASGTLAHYVQSIRGFTRWAVRSGRAPVDQLASVRKPNPETDRKIRRRMILPDEWPWLLKTLSVNRMGVPRAERAILYEVAIQTALRASELRSLRVAMIDLDHLTITAQSGDTKDAHRATQHITPGLASRLRVFLANRSGDEPLFKLCSPTNLARMIQADFVTARKAWIESVEDKKEQEERERTDFLAVKNHAGLSLDFHSLRHTCGAWLAKKGVHPKTIQAIMRHSTITLTLDTYGHLMPGAEPEAIAKLESMFG